MQRRDFIKNSLLFLGGVCLAGGGFIAYDAVNKDSAFQEILLNRKLLNEKLKSKDDLPKILRIDACTLCNLHCPCCYRETEPEIFKEVYGLGYLKFSDFKKVVDQNCFKRIELSNKGEIFLNPELLDIIKYAYEKGVDLTAFNGVNLNYLTDEMAEALVKYKFKSLIVSIDGATPEIYAIYRRGGNFNTVIKNIKKINYYKKKYNSKYPELTYKFIVFGHNEHEIDKAKILAKKLDMKMQFDVNAVYDYSPITDLKLVEKKTGKDFSHTALYYQADKFGKNKDEWFFCKQLWEEPQISWDGRILGCCFVSKKDFGGNAFKDGLFNALNNPKMIYAKNMLANNAKPIPEIPCTDCSILKLVKKFDLNVKTK